MSNETLQPAPGDDEAGTTARTNTGRSQRLGGGGEQDTPHTHDPRTNS